MPNQVHEQDAQTIIRTTALGRFAVGGAINPRRRVWFKDGNEEQDAPDIPETDGETPERDWTGVPDWVRTTIEAQERQIKILNHEAQTRRLEFENAQKQLHQLTTAQKKQLEQDGNFKALAEQYESELIALRPAQERADALDKTIRDSNTRRMEQLPEAMRGLVPTEYAPEKLATWMDTNWAMLTRKAAPDMDAGVGGGSGKKTPVKLSDYERTIARAGGLTDEEYARFKTRGQPGIPDDLLGG